MRLNLSASLFSITIEVTLRFLLAIADPEIVAELLLEELLGLQLSCPTFRQVYKSQQTIEIFVQAFKSFVKALNSAVVIEQRTVRMLEKMMHFGVTIAMDNVVAGNQKAEVCAETITTSKRETRLTIWTGGDCDRSSK